VGTLAGVDDTTWTAVDDYWSRALLPPDPVLDAALDANAAGGLPAIDVSPLQGRLLFLLARSIGARRVLEVGTLGGYSTICMGRALPAGGELITCELVPEHAEVARANLARAGVSELATVLAGPAVRSLAGLTGAFDLVFIDADKAANLPYLNEAVRLSHPGTVIMVDNVVRSGSILDAGSANPAVVGTRQLADALAADPRLDATVIQTVGGKGYDGFLYAVVR
jgi:predicted O-methyltransferase YrrM